MNNVRHCPFCGRVIDPEENARESCKQRINPNRAPKKEEQEVKKEEPMVGRVEVNPEKLNQQPQTITITDYKCPLCGRQMDTNSACCERCRSRRNPLAPAGIIFAVIYIIAYGLLFLLFFSLFNNGNGFFGDDESIKISEILQSMLFSFIITLALYIKAIISAKVSQSTGLLALYKLIAIVHVLIIIALFFIE